MGLAPQTCFPINVFDLQLLQGGGVRILLASGPPDATRKILDCLALPSNPPPICPAELPKVEMQFP
jgi:hypothetical protein